MGLANGQIMRPSLLCRMALIGHFVLPCLARVRFMCFSVGYFYEWPMPITIIGKRHFFSFFGNSCFLLFCLLFLLKIVIIFFNFFLGWHKNNIFDRFYGFLVTKLASLENIETTTISKLLWLIYYVLVTDTSMQPCY